MPDGIPPWLTRDRDPTAAYVQGLQLGQQGLESARRAQALQIEQYQRAQEQAMQAQAQQERAAIAQAELAQEIQKQQEAADVAREELNIKRQVQQEKDRAAALKYAGAQALQQEIDSGVPMSQAVLRHPEIWMGSAESMSGALKLAQPPFSPSTVAQPITTPEGATIAHRVQTSPNQYSIQHLPKENLTQNQLFSAGAREVNALFQQLKTVTSDEDEEKIRKKIDEILGHMDTIRTGGNPEPEKEGKEPPKPKPTKTKKELPVVKTKAEYDALKSGDEYIGKDGKKYRKP